MIGFSNQKGRDIRKPVPGCMGRMINLFDLGSGVSGNKLLTDKPHGDGLQITRDCMDDVQNESDPAVCTVKEKPVVNLPKCLSTNSKANGTPMKMLMAEELLKEREVACKQPTVIAKLMGLDALPAEQSIETVKRATQDRGAYEGHNSKKIAPPPQGSSFPERLAILRPQQHPLHYRVQQRQECKDVYEIRPQIQGTKNLEHASQCRGKHDYSINNKRMALVRQKFVEAKRLATSQNVLQSKEFQDALEVLSLNRDLFHKFLEEPDLMLSQHLQGQQQQQQAHNYTANRGKRITVLRPMPQTSATNTARQAQMENSLIHETNRRIKNDSCQSSRAGLQVPGSLLPQPTRIVVLKPSPGKNRNAVSREASFPPTTICVPKQPVCNEGPIHNEARDARVVAKDIARQMRESLSRRDETLLSHILSNVTTDEDEDSFSRSGKEHVEEEDECTCSSTSQDSWKYRDAFGSPCPFSSRSKYPYWPESSVIREAKRRLSERWVLVTSGGVGQEPPEIQRSSSTLGEMLSIREAKKREEDSKEENFGFTARKNSDDCRSNGHQMTLQRSRSVLQSCSSSEKAELDAKAVNLDSGNKYVIDEAVDKTKYFETLSFKGKVSNLFFSRNNKTSNTDKSPSYSSFTDRITHGRSSQSGNREFTVKSDHSPLQCSVDVSPKEGPIFNYEELLRKNLYSTNSDSDLGTPASSKKESLPLEKLMASEDGSDNNLEQPSPVSVLEVQFEDDAVSNGSSSLPRANATQERHRASPRRLSTEPVACSLSWDDDDDGDDSQVTTNHSKPVAIKNSTEEEEEEYLAFARLLLSCCSLGNETSIAMMRWHSLDSPLDPSLLGTFLEPKEEAAKSRVRRSNQRLLFDCVNTTIMDISRSNLLDSCPWPWPVFGRPTPSPVKPAASVTEEEILGAVRSLLSANNHRRPLANSGSLWSDDSSKSSVVADLIIRKEISGREWDEEMVEIEVLEMVVEIQGQVVDELVAEALCC